MTTTKAFLILLFIVAYCLLLRWLWQPDYSVDIDPRHYGADAMTVAWSGEVKAYRWDGTGYRLMWRRR